MNLKTIKLINWQSFRGEHTIEIPTGLVRITGINKDRQGARSNRAGKTGFLNSVIVGLYNKTPLVAVASKLINDQEKFASIGLEFDSGFCPTRYLKHPKWGNALHINGTMHTQDQLESALGMGFNAFVSTVFFGTNSSDFLEKILRRPTEAKDLLTSLLPNLQIFDQALKWVTYQISNIEDRNIELDRDISGATGKLELLHGYDFLTKITEWETTHQNRLKELQTELTRLKTKLKNLTPPNVHALTEDHRRWSQETQRLSSLKNQTQRASDKSERDIEFIDNSVAAVDKELKTLAEGRCPTCGKPLSNTTKLVAERKEILKIWADKRSTAMKLMEIAVKESIALTKNIAAAQENLSVVQSELNKSTMVIADFNTLASIEKAIAKEQLEVNPYIQSAEQIKQQIEQEEARKSKFFEDKAKLVDLLKYYQFWVTGFGSRGIKNFVFDEIVFRLTDIAQSYLDFMTEGTISLQFDPRKEKKKGGFTETIGLEVYSESEPRDFFTWSQSERKKVSLATSLAMNKLLREMFHSQFDFLIFDESFDGLDDVGIELFCKLLRTLLTDIKTILVVHHTPYADDQFDHTLTSVKEHGVSHIDQGPPKTRLNRG